MTSFPSERDEAGRAFERNARENAPTDEGSIAHLLGGLVADAQQLVRREVDLAKTEVTNEVNKVKQGAASLGAGIGAATIGGILLGHMLVYLLQDVFGIALWIAFLIVGGVLTLLGVLLLRQGASRMSAVDPMPRETIDSVRKDVEWITQQNPSDKT